MYWIVKIWNQLPPEVRAILHWVFDEHLGELITVLGFLSPLLAWKKIRRAYTTFRAKRNLIKRLPDYSPQEIELGIKYYIWPECQSVDPSQSDEARHTIAVRNDLYNTMTRLLTQETTNKHFIILADSGMGKTSFLLNYFAKHLHRLRKPFKMELIPLSVPGLQNRLKDVATPKDTVLLLDALDEDTEAIRNHAKRLGYIMHWTRDFYRIVITCRTQFFPRDEEIPKETGIIKVGPRQAGEGPQFTFYKLYLSPFSDDQVQDYLKRRFSIWRKTRRIQASAIVDKIPNLAVRPMLLAYVDDLIESGKFFENSFQIYGEMVDAWLKREREHVDDKKALLEFSNKLAVELFVNREKRGSERIPYEEINTLAEKFRIKLNTWQLTGRSLLNRDAEGNYKFAHRSILEFLFATQVLDNYSEAAKLPVEHWTEQVMNFISEGLDDKSWITFSQLIRAGKLDGKQWATFNIFVPFEGGKFNLGETGKTFEIKPFEISTHQVTNREYEEFDPSHRKKRDKYSDQDDQPVVYVSWEDATKYCQWLSRKAGESYRLPTEAEWEYAASGCGQRKYPWGNEDPTPKHTNYRDSKISKTTPVGTYHLGMTPEGLFDMAGNIWEWCADWYDKVKNSRVVRGGSFDVDPYNLRCAVRDRGDPHDRSVYRGFRVVRSV